MVGARFLVFAVCLCIAQCLAASRSLRAETAVVHVAIFTSAGTTSSDLVPALLHAERIFAREGIVVTFAAAGVAGSAMNRSPTTLRVVLVDHGTGPRDVLGIADIPSGTAWVFFQRVQVAVRASAAPEAIILGHVIAHELGHLLIGSRDHRVSGLMTETLSFTDAEQGILRFLPEDVRQIRERVGAPR